MGPDVMVLCYGYGALVASCKADKAGEVKHVEALCKLGIATAPSAFGDTFPVVRYALVHGASADRALECSSIEQSLHNARTSARTIRAQNFPTVAALANFAKTTTVPLTEWLLYAVVHEAAMLNRRYSAGAWRTALSEACLTFHTNGLEAFLKRSGKNDVAYIVATHESTILSPMPLPAGVGDIFKHGSRKITLGPLSIFAGAVLNEQAVSGKKKARCKWFSRGMPTT